MGLPPSNIRILVWYFEINNQIHAHTHTHTSKEFFNFKNESIINAFQQTLMSIFDSSLKNKQKCLFCIRNINVI